MRRTVSVPDAAREAAVRPSPDFDASVAQLRATGSVKWSQHPEALGAFVAEMDFGTAPAVTRALHDTVDQGLLGYLPDALVAHLGEAFAGWAGERYDWVVAPQRVRPLADVISGLQAVIAHFSEPGSAVIVPTPSYMPFLYVPPTMGRQVIEVPMAVQGGRYVYDLAALEAAYDAGGHLLLLCDPHNPTGRVHERHELEEVAAVVSWRGGRVFADEIHAPLVYDGHRHLPYAALSEATAQHTVTAASASKAWNVPGTKCAQLVLSNDADAQTWAEVGQAFEHGASTLGVAANIAAYERGGAWLDDVLGRLDQHRTLLGDLLADRLPRVGYTQPEGTYLAWLDCRALGLGDHPADFFREQAGVALTDGSACGRVGAGFVRHNLATPRPILEETVSRMADALARR